MHTTSDSPHEVTLVETTLDKNLTLGRPRRLAASDIANDITPHLKELVVSILNLDMSPDEIDPNTPLFGKAGLGLDSIDILEVSLAISKRYGFQLRSADENNEQIFSSLNALAEQIALHLTKINLDVR